MVACALCAHPVPAGARFCPSCGNPVVSIAVAVEERRVVTVLFADLVGYTTLAEYLDPERVKRLVEACFERLVADIEQFGGRVDKLLGDAIVALFGAPVAHEDDAERAVRAALRMQSTLARFVDEVGRRSADPDAHRHQHRRGSRRHARRLRLHGDGRRRQHRCPPPVAGADRRCADRLGDGRAVLVDRPARAARRHPHPWPRAARAVVARHRRVGSGEPARPLRRARSSAATTSAPCSTPPCSSCATVAAASSPSSVRPAPASHASPTRSSSVLEDEAIVIRTACAPYGETNSLAPVINGLSALLALDPEATAADIEAAVRARSFELWGLDADDEAVRRYIDTVTFLLGHTVSARSPRPGDSSRRRRRHVDRHAAARRPDADDRAVGRQPAVGRAEAARPARVLVRTLSELPFLLITCQRPDPDATWPPVVERPVVLQVPLGPLRVDEASTLVRGILERGDADHRRSGGRRARRPRRRQPAVPRRAGRSGGDVRLGFRAAWLAARVDRRPPRSAPAAAAGVHRQRCRARYRQRHRLARALRQGARVRSSAAAISTSWPPTG